MAEAQVEAVGPNKGVLPGVSYPLKVQYCGECTLPLEYCEYAGMTDKCKAWLQANLPDMFMQMYTAEEGEGDGQSADDKKRQKRGGKGGAPKVKPKTEVEQHITLQRSSRGKNKSVTVVKGLSTCGIELKVASKYFASKFACGASVTGADEIVIQGDVKDDLCEIIPDKWNNVDEDCIEDLGDMKR